MPENYRIAMSVLSVASTLVLSYAVTLNNHTLCASAMMGLILLLERCEETGMTRLRAFLAGVMTAHFGKKGNTVKNRMLGCGMPVAFNAVIVGAVLTWAYQLREFSDPLASFAFNGLTVGLGEAGVLYLIGYPLLVSLPKMKFFREYMEKINKP